MIRPRRFRIEIPKPFDLRLALFGHGWVDLPPHQWDGTRWRVPIRAGDGRILEPEIRSHDRGIEVRHGSEASDRPAIETALRRMLRLDEDFSELWKLCRKDPGRRWVSRSGAGRLLCSQHLFEDLLKLVFTTNCAWGNTRSMTTRLMESLGEPSESGLRAFPTAERCAAAGESFFREVVRAGYRARSCALLSESFASGDLRAETFEAERSTADLRKRLLALPGFGPYAAGQALRLLGHYQDLALDSWCRSRCAELQNRRKPLSDKSIEKSYASYEKWAGLVLWLDLTADWHRGKLSRPAPQQ